MSHLKILHLLQEFLMTAIIISLHGPMRQKFT